jgi:hypothetical protein
MCSLIKKNICLLCKSMKKAESLKLLSISEDSRDQLSIKKTRIQGFMLLIDDHVLFIAKVFSS